MSDIFFLCSERGLNMPFAGAAGSRKILTCFYIRENLARLCRKNVRTRATRM